MATLLYFVKNKILAIEYKITQAGAPKTNVRVRIRRSIVEVQREGTSIRTIVPIPATDEASPVFCSTAPLLFLF